MDLNTLSSKQDLHHLHNTTEGHFERIMTLLLLTNKKGAYQVLKENRFPRDTREFGPGHYFVETLDESESFDIEERAVVACQVFVGVSLVLTHSLPGISEKYLKSRNCNSLKGFLNSTQKYYVIYNYKQVQKVLALKAEQSVVRPYEFYKCTNYLCKFHGQHHYEECPLKCLEKNCRFYNGFHVPPCHLKCCNQQCEMFETFHELGCKNRCTWENCINLGRYHEGKCIHLDHENEVETTEVVYNKVRFDSVIEKNRGNTFKEPRRKSKARQVSKEKTVQVSKHDSSGYSWKTTNTVKKHSKGTQEYYSNFPSLNPNEDKQVYATTKSIQTSFNPVPNPPVSQKAEVPMKQSESKPFLSSSSKLLPHQIPKPQVNNQRFLETSNALKKVSDSKDSDLNSKLIKTQPIKPVKPTESKAVRVPVVPAQPGPTGICGHIRSICLLF